MKVERIRTMRDVDGAAGGGRTPAPGQGGSRAVRRWLVLAIVLGGAFLVMVAGSSATLAIPSIRRTFGATFGEVQLVVASYVLVYALFLIAGGRLGDRYGRKRVLLAGIALFTLATAVCGLAPNVYILILARAAQGFGAALMYPQFLAIIQDTFEGRDRDIALGLFGAVIGLGLVLGQLMGGAIVSLDISGLSWRPAFLALVPIGGVALVAAAVLLDTRRATVAARLDGAGTLALGMALALFILPLMAGRDAGWPAWMLVALIASIPAFALFLWVEGRVASPLLDPGLFRQRAFVVGCLLGVAVMALLAGFLFITSLTLQVGAGASALQAALVQAPLGLAFFAGSLLAPRLVPGLGRHVLSLGYAILVLGVLTTLTAVRASGGSMALLALVPGLAVMGLGLGLGVTPLIGTVLSAVRREQMGGVAGVIPTAFQVGQVCGIGLIGLYYITVLGGRPAGVSLTVRFLGAYEAALPLLAALAALCLVLVFVLPRPAGVSENVLLERLPGRVAGLAYSLYFLTGGRAGDRSISALLQRTIEHRTARAQEAPRAPGEFLVHHYLGMGEEDRAWLHYLVEEALARGAGPVPHETERQRVMARQVDEIRSRQAEGVVDEEFDPGALRLLVFALVSYPLLLPQVVRLATGHHPDSPAFDAIWERLLRQVGARLEGSCRP
jgi:MFS family permease